MTIHRRHFLAGTISGAVATTFGLGSLPARAQAKTTVAALFSGSITDGGFMEAGYRGLVAARDRLGCEITFKEKVKPDRASLEAALRELAATSPTLVVAHGGQNNEAAKAVAAEFPALRFVVTQGAVTGPNLASYEVLQEQSAFLAGALAAWTTNTGVVGHMSGIRVVPGLKGRAAYANGVAHADPKVRLITNFSGNQDDNALSKKIALAMADAQADVIFTMLNAGRTGAIEACRERGIWQIGNVGDFVARDPAVFLGSAMADAGLALFNAASDVVKGTFEPGRIRHIGLTDPAAVRLSVNPKVPADVHARIAALAAEIASGTLVVSTTWSGEEFPNPA